MGKFFTKPKKKNQSALLIDSYSYIYYLPFCFHWHQSVPASRSSQPNVLVPPLSIRETGCNLGWVWGARILSGTLSGNMEEAGKPDSHLERWRPIPIHSQYYGEGLEACSHSETVGAIAEQAGKPLSILDSEVKLAGGWDTRFFSRTLFVNLYFGKHPWVNILFSSIKYSWDGIYLFTTFYINCSALLWFGDG